MSKSNYILITGASSGIGEGLARAFASRKCNLILTARRAERLESLKKELEAPDISIQVVPHDMFEDQSAQKLFTICQSNGWQIDGLVNNAGLGWQIDLHTLNEEQVDRMLQVNLVSLTHMCRLFLPQMIERKKGFILNVASTAAFQPVPHFSVYAATKAYVLNLSEGLYEEVKGANVLVSALCPGPTHTEFQKLAEMPKRFFSAAQTVDEVVNAAMRGLDKRKAVIWTSWFQRSFTLFSDLTPRPIIRWCAARVLEMAGAKKTC